MTDSEKSWILDLYDSLTTCLGKIWIYPSFKRHASLMEMEQRHREETEDLFDISLDTGTQPPSEMVDFKFHIKMPIYIARQHMRHRTASINELSARYSVVPRDYYEPDVMRAQSVVNRQGSEGEVDVPDELAQKVNKHLGNSFDVYEELLESGCCREQSRGNLPQSTYTEFYWKINLHNLLHYLHLRMEPGAQQEIREYANAIYDLIKDLLPITMEAFMDFRINAIQLTGPEIEAIRNGGTLTSPGERRESEEKLKKLNLFERLTTEGGCEKHDEKNNVATS